MRLVQQVSPYRVLLQRHLWWQQKEPWNVASIALADGPAGLRLKKELQVENGRIVPTDFLSALEGGFFATSKEKRGTSYYQYCTAIPVGTLLAQTLESGPCS